jgi:hypothetical protein
MIRVPQLGSGRRSSSRSDNACKSALYQEVLSEGMNDFDEGSLKGRFYSHYSSGVQPPKALQVPITFDGFVGPYHLLLVSCFRFPGRNY